MSDYDDLDFEARMSSHENVGATSGEWKRKALRFLRYLSTRKMECWGFFAAGYLIATIF